MNLPQLIKRLKFQLHSTQEITPIEIQEIVRWHDTSEADLALKYKEGYLACMQDLVKHLEGASSYTIVGMGTIMPKLREKAKTL